MKCAYTFNYLFNITLILDYSILIILMRILLYAYIKGSIFLIPMNQNYYYIKNFGLYKNYIE